jgi:hypothetical protein
MWRALILVCAALLVSAVELLYFSLPGAFLLQLGFGECFRSSGWHAFWSVAAWVTPLLTPVLLWMAARALRERPRHPIFGLNILVVFVCGLLIASGFFALRLLWRLDSPLLQASLFVGYCLTLDLCSEAASWRRFTRPVWLSLCFVVAISAAYSMRKFPPAVRSADLGEMRVRLLGRVIYRKPAPVCLSAAALASVNWRSEELKRADLRQACVAWPYRIELPQVFQQCVRTPVENVPPAREGELREETKIVSGDTAVGAIHILGQVHHRDEDTPQQRWSVLESQLHIYNELRKHPEWTIFSEGTCLGNLAPERRGSANAMAVARDVRGKFSLAQEWSPAYTRVMLASLGAVGALDEVGAIDSNATSRCDDEKLRELDRIEEQFELTVPGAPQYESLLARMNELRMDYREREAIRQIRSYLSDVPGDKIFLVYGEAHGFAEALWREAFGAKLPEVKMVRWSTPVSAGWDLEELHGSAERLRWIQSAPAFTLSAVSLARSPNELLAMLPKLRGEPLRDLTPEAARERLLAMLDGLAYPLPAEEHLRVSEWMYRSYARREGPFAVFRVEENGEARVGEIVEPYAQRERLKALRRLPLEEYQDLMMPEARIDAIGKLEIPPALTAEEVKDYLDAANYFVVDMGGKLAARVRQRFGAEAVSQAMRQSMRQRGKR